jgi:hypothetical protein
MHLFQLHITTSEIVLLNWRNYISMPSLWSVIYNSKCERVNEREYSIVTILREARIETKRNIYNTNTAIRIWDIAMILITVSHIPITSHSVHCHWIISVSLILCIYTCTRRCKQKERRCSTLNVFMTSDDRCHWEQFKSERDFLRN